MIMCIQNLVNFLSIHSQDIEQKTIYDRMTERETDRQNDGQGESSIAPLFQSEAIIKDCLLTTYLDEAI